MKTVCEKRTTNAEAISVEVPRREPSPCLMRMIALTIPVLLLSNPLQAQAKSFYVLTPQVGQGGTAVVQMLPQFLGSDCIYVFGDEYKPNKKGYAIIGIKSDQKPDKYPVFRVPCGGARDNWDYEELEVIETNFDKTRIATFTGKPKPRTGRQKRAIDKAFDQPDKLTDLTNGRNYIYPLDAAVDIIDPFGPIYGNNPYLFHTGIDWRARVGTPVKAVNGGRIVLVAKNYRRSREGNMLILYHGLGIYSVYMHLSKFRVKADDIVERGQVIGLTGKTGAGAYQDPHLHWNIKEHNTYVDPFVFVDTIDQHIK